MGFEQTKGRMDKKKFYGTIINFDGQWGLTLEQGVL